VRARIEALFLRNIGKIVTRQQIIKASKDPRTGVEPENWHQRLSELRTDVGYTIQTGRDRPDLKPGQYVMPSADRRKGASGRVRPTPETWQRVLARARHTCEWTEGDTACALKNGDLDPVGGGTVRLTPDHMHPHSMDPRCDPDDPGAWRALCGRHQVIKRNFWDSTSGKLNVYAIVQASTRAEKRKVFEFLLEYFRDENKTDE
jgi:hypothetical protein